MYAWYYKGMYANNFPMYSKFECTFFAAGKLHYWSNFKISEMYILFGFQTNI